MPLGRSDERLWKYSGAGTPCWVEGLGVCSFSAFTYRHANEEALSARVSNAQGSTDVPASDVWALIYVINEEP